MPFTEGERERELESDSDTLKYAHFHALKC